MRPFSKARRVNSPASACRKPASADRRFKTASTTALPPCRCSSTTSSPVKLFGPAKNSTTPLSMIVPSPARMALTVASRSAGTPHRLRRASRAAGPEMRMIATPEGSEPLDRAKIVSRNVIRPAVCRCPTCSIYG